jgi:hypothetical protein
MKLTNPTWVSALNLIEWTAWTPTISSDGGPITISTGTFEYLRIGDIVFFHFSMTLSASGTGHIWVTTPVGLTPVGATGFTGQEYAATGSKLSGMVLGSGYLIFLRYDAASLATSGNAFLVNGFYRIAE